jgi:LEA14-like dessication related protein
MVEEFEGLDGMLISNGEKVKVFELLPNDFDFTTLALPAEAEFFPSWLNEHFRIDFKSTEEKLITAKLEGIFSAWGYEVPTPFKSRVNKLLKF